MSSLALEITVFKKSAGVLSKTIAAAVDGSPVSDGSACRMSSGEAKRMPLPGGAQALAELIDNMASDEALSLGRLVSGVGKSAPVTTVSRLRSAPEGTIARSLDFLEFMENTPAFMLLDIDRKGMPQAVADRIKAAGGVVPLLTELFPALMKAPASSARRLQREFSTQPQAELSPGRAGCTSMCSSKTALISRGRWPLSATDFG